MKTKVVKRVEVVMPVHNRRVHTRRCLKSLSRLDRKGIELHITVVDDGSNDGTSEMLAAEFPDVNVVRGSGDLWYTAGTNRGIEAALKRGPDYILACNDDSIFDSKSVVQMVGTAERYPRSVVGALLLNWEEPHRVMQVSPEWKLSNGGYRHWRRQTVWTVPDRPWRVHAIVGNCVLYPAQAIREAGLMDEKRLVQYGDAEYTPRMRRLGWQLLIEPRARVFSEPNRPVTGFRKMPLGRKFTELFLKPGGQYSFKRRFYATAGGAPNKFIGALAVGVFFFRFAIGRNLEGDWALSGHEPPLKETFADQILHE